MDERESGNGPATNGKPQDAGRKGTQALARACGAMYSHATIELCRSDAAVCAVPHGVGGSAHAPTATTPMLRLHVAFKTLADRWEAAARRPDRTETGRDAHLLAHSTGDDRDLLVIYVGYERGVHASIHDALARAARFASACGLRTLGVTNPASIDPSLTAAQLKMAVQEMAAQGVELTLHESK